MSLASVEGLRAKGSDLECPLQRLPGFQSEKHDQEFVNSFLGQLTGRLPHSVRYVNQLEHGEVGFRGPHGMNMRPLNTPSMAWALLRRFKRRSRKDASERVALDESSVSDGN